MNPELEGFLHTLHSQGVEHDASKTDRLERRRNLDPETAEFVAMLMRLMSARNVVEVGTSNGYGTIWLADAMKETGGRVTSLDVNPQDEAIANTTQAGVQESVDFVQQDAGEYLVKTPDDSVDVLFLDGERTEYAGWWPHPVRVLRPGGLMLIDNAHKPSPEELADFVALLETDPNIEQLTLEIGSGLILARKKQS